MIREAAHPLLAAELESESSEELESIARSYNPLKCAADIAVTALWNLFSPTSYTPLPEKTSRYLAAREILSARKYAARTIQ